MPDNVIPLVIAAVVGTAIAAVAGYYIARFLRGSITMVLPRTAFNPGDALTGSLTLQAKKTIQGNKLTASLVGTQVTRTRQNDGKTRTQSREIYRDEVLIAESMTYPAGHTGTYDFSIAVPDMGAPSFMDSTLGQALSTALSLLNHSDSHVTWRVEARLDAKGIDLATSKTVSINMKRLG